MLIKSFFGIPLTSFPLSNNMQLFCFYLHLLHTHLFRKILIFYEEYHGVLRATHIGLHTIRLCFQCTLHNARLNACEYATCFYQIRENIFELLKKDCCYSTTEIIIFLGYFVGVFSDVIGCSGTMCIVHHSIFTSFVNFLFIPSLFHKNL